MSRVWLTSDWHLGHRNIAKFRPCVSSMEDNTEQLVTNYNKLITKRDIVWFLGDVAFDPEHLAVIASLPGDKRLVLGNHDTDRKVDIANLCLVFDQIHGLYRYKAAWLSHAPIHPDELRGKINIHGHTHSHFIMDDRYVNVCVENTGMRPILYQDIIGSYKYRMQKDNCYE